MLPVVKMERLEVFKCDECSFTASEKLAVDYHQVMFHRSIKEEIVQDRAEVSANENEDVVLML